LNMIPKTMPLLVFIVMEHSVDEGDPVHDYMNVGHGGVVNAIDELVSGGVVRYTTLSDVIQGAHGNVFRIIGGKSDKHVTCVVECFVASGTNNLFHLTRCEEKRTYICLTGMDGFVGGETTAVY